MPKIKYRDIRFSADKLDVVDKANLIIEEYQAEGYDLTLRQLYYQFVSRDWIPNTQQSYKRLGEIVSDARLAGLIDWEAIVDRTRNLKSLSTWDDPAEIVGACARQFRNDLWATQDARVECWVEKEALAGVVERACNEWRVPFFSCRGYTSQSEMWVAAQRMQGYFDAGQAPIILHLGDHDPSGIDMTRDLEARLELFCGGVRVNRLALNIDQVEEYNPPPNPAKITDPRATVYVKRFGDESWELDALNPQTLSNLIQDAIRAEINTAAWEAATMAEEDHRRDLSKVAARYDDVKKFLSKRKVA